MPRTQDADPTGDGFSYRAIKGIHAVKIARGRKLESLDFLALTLAKVMEKTVSFAPPARAGVTAAMRAAGYIVATRLAAGGIRLAALRAACN
jgi:hypothetical protein